MNPLLQQLVSLAPGIASGVRGNGPGMQAFLEAYQRQSALMDQQEQQRQALGVQQADRQRQITRQGEQDSRQKELDRIAAEDRQRRITLESLQVGPALAEQAAALDSPDAAKAFIEQALPSLMSVYGDGVMAQGQPAVNMAQQTITGRQQRQVREFVDQALKTSFVADNPDSDPVIDNLPSHLQAIVGKPSAKLSELQQFAQLPVGKPAGKPSDDVSLQSKEVMVGGKLALVNYNPKTGKYTDQSGNPVVVDAVPPKPTGSSGDPEVAELRKELLRLQVENAGKPKEPNQSQFLAGGYAGRMEQAEPILAKVAPGIQNMSLLSFQTQTESWFAKPTFQSAEVQSYMQAARNFINAVLRRESGAVISPEEFANAKAQYLPVPNDTPEALAQKAANREYVTRQMKRAAGAAYEAPIVPDGATPPPAAAPTSGPKLKERRKIKGQLAEWDGKGWLPVVK